MARDFVGPVVGLLLLAFGLGLMRWHVVGWQAQRDEEQLSDRERNRYYRRFRRRMQTSGMLALLGLMIAVGDALVPWQRFPNLFVVWIGLMLLLVLWIILLALGDLASTTAHSRHELARVRQEQRALELRLEELKGRRSNGRRPDE